MGIAGHSSYTVTDLWSGVAQTMTEDELTNWTVTVPGALTPDGGFRIFKIEPADGAAVQDVTDTDASVNVSPGFSTVEDPNAFNGTLVTTQLPGNLYGSPPTPGQSITYQFDGQSIAVFGETEGNGLTAEVYIDGAAAGSINEASADGATHYQVPLFEDFNLSPGAHTIKILVSQESENEYFSAAPGIFSFDGFAVGLNPGATAAAAATPQTTTGSWPASTSASTAVLDSPVVTGDAFPGAIAASVAPGLVAGGAVGSMGAGEPSRTSAPPLGAPVVKKLGTAVGVAAGRLELAGRTVLRKGGVEIAAFCAGTPADLCAGRLILTVRERPEGRRSRKRDGETNVMLGNTAFRIRGGARETLEVPMRSRQRKLLAGMGVRPSMTVTGSKVATTPRRARLMETTRVGDRGHEVAGVRKSAWVAS